ncbi:MAG: pirin family protein [Cyclobacteriaceae bacterium]|nr:pirin family protein [Cyclobacteriaceae bacterium]
MNQQILKIFPLGFPWATRDPFLFCVHHADAYPRGNKQLGPATSVRDRNIGNDFVIKDGWRMYHGTKIPGFPAHPHRGFETVTVVEQGLIDHADSMGAAARFGFGDVQWMTAGKGVQHSEMFPLLQQESENPLELFQIWLNLPRAGKYVEPYFSMQWSENIPLVKHRDADNRETTIKIVSGTLDTVRALAPPPDSWAANDSNDVGIWIIAMDTQAKWSMPAAREGINRNLYFFDGASIEVAGEELTTYKGMELHESSEISLQNGSKPSRLLLLQGRPMEEPVVQHGPFVMNSEGEIRQTMLDYQRTQFGGWPWTSNEYVHGPDRGRFARYADGKEEQR